MASIFTIACSSDSASDWKEQDFMKHGLPVKFKAPDNVQVSKSNFSGSEEFKLTGSSDYGMNVMVLAATSSDASRVKSELESLVKEGKYFTRFVENESDGFIYQITVDSVHSVYGFRKVKIQGGKQVVFQNPYMSKLTEEQARKLYKAVSE